MADQRDFPKGLQHQPADDDDLVRRLLEQAGPRSPLPREDIEAIASSARAAWEWRQRRRRRLALRRVRWTLSSLAAALAVAVGLGWGGRWWAGLPAPLPVARVEQVAGTCRLESADGPARPIAPTEEIAAGARLSSGAGGAAGRASLRLASGALVRLDQGTRLALTDARTLRLESGAVYVDAGGEVRGLEVWTPSGIVRDVGTRFSVRIPERPDVLLRVLVRDGSVAVEQLGRSTVAAAGEELSLSTEGVWERRAAPPFGPEWEWTLAVAPRFPIEGRSLAEFLDWVGHETGWQVRFADAGLAAAAREIRLHGGIGSLRPDQAAFAVLPGAGLEGRLDAGVLTVARR